MRINFIRKAIDFIRGKKDKFQNIVLHKQYRKRLIQLRSSYESGKKIRIGFYVVFDSVFPAAPVYEECLEDDMFDPFILVIPDSLRGTSNMHGQMEKTYQALSTKYGNVLRAYDENTHSFQDFSDRADMVFFANPYDAMTHEFYTIHYNAIRGVLPLYASYATIVNHYAVKHVINLPSINMCWKVFVDTAENLEEYRKFTDMRGRNAVLTGYCKMDALDRVEPTRRSRKKIIIAPHHTVEDGGILYLSNFLAYSDFFLQLPEKYPHIDFVFRPHPLWGVTLSKPELWGCEGVKAYLGKMTSHSNVEYQDGGDYFNTFVNSDAMIHDCSSFVFEYLFTEHPVCFMLKPGHSLDETFNPLGQGCIEQAYPAYNEQQIIDFIENVVISGKDGMAGPRQAYAQKLKLNYPKVSHAIIRHIKGSLESSR